MSAPTYTDVSGTLHKLHPTRPHDMMLDEDGDLNQWRLEYAEHNGPECTRCGSWCQHCERARFSAPCERIET